MSEQYFSGIRVGDRIWTIQEGWTEVEAINSTYHHPISTCNGCYTMDGRNKIYDAHQSAFWSDPGIVAPPRPKRMKKVNVEVRPLMGSYLSVRTYDLDNSMTDWRGPVQFVEVEIEE